MIDVVAVREALEGVLAVRPDLVLLKVGKTIRPPSEGPHVVLMLDWERQARTGAVLTEGAGTWHMLVRAPPGAGTLAVERLALDLGGLYEPHVDADEQLGGFVRVCEVVVLNAKPVTLVGETGRAATWIQAPVQVDFRIETIPAALV